jgi:Uma2 family endonuclease
MAEALSARALPRPTKSPLLTSEQFIEWLQPGVLADLIGGEICMHSPVHLRHARLINFVDRLLGQYVEERGSGELHRETVAVRLSVRDTFMPDLAYFTPEQVPRLLETHAPFAPALVVEALSPATARRDTGVKFAAYEAHGVQEYWVLDPEKLGHRFYARAGDMLVEFAMDSDRIESFSVHGFWLRRDWLDPKRLPRVSDCLREVLRGSRNARGSPRTGSAE